MGWSIPFFFFLCWIEFIVLPDSGTIVIERTMAVRTIHMYSNDSHSQIWLCWRKKKVSRNHDQNAQPIVSLLSNRFAEIWNKEEFPGRYWYHLRLETSLHCSQLEYSLTIFIWILVVRMTEMDGYVPFCCYVCFRHSYIWSTPYNARLN